MNNRFSMKIKHKLLLLGAFAIFSVVFVGANGVFSLKHAVELEQAEIKIGAIAESMLNLRRHEKDFLMRLDMKYLDKFNGEFETLTKEMNSVSEILSENDINGDLIDNTAASLNEYRNGFNQLVLVYQRIGLNPQDGLYGSLRSAVHNVEKSLNGFNEAKLARDMLLLRRREKDFMLRDDLKYVQKFEKDFVVMSDNLRASALSATDKGSIQSLLDSYRRDFLALVEGYQERGLSPQDGLRGTMREAVHSTEQQISQIKEELIVEIDERVSADQMKSLTIVSVFTLILIVVIFYIINGIIRPMTALKNTIEESFKNRDLTTHLEFNGRDEFSDIAAVYNQMTGDFRDIIKRITGSAAQVTESAESLAVLTSQSRNGMAQQQDESQQVASAMDEMTASVQEVSRSASDAAESSRTADEETKQGRTVVNEAVEGIESLVQEVTQTSQVIRELEDESENIGTVLNVIQALAEQTNLLALNAAIEAARAGGSGRGFAVVADEVRQLAQRSQEATEEINAIIERLQEGAKNAATAMEKGLEQTSRNAEQVHAAGQSLDLIASAVSSITTMNDHIAHAANEQSTAAEEINRNIFAIADVTSQTSLATENISQTSTDLATLANDLRVLIAQFKVDDRNPENAMPQDERPADQLVPEKAQISLTPFNTDIDLPESQVA